MIKEKRKSVAERIEEVYNLLQGRGPTSILELAIDMNMSHKYLREEILPVALLVHKDIQLQMSTDDTDSTKIKLVII